MRKILIGLVAGSALTGAVLLALLDRASRAPGAVENEAATLLPERPRATASQYGQTRASSAVLPAVVQTQRLEPDEEPAAVGAESASVRRESQARAPLALRSSVGALREAAGVGEVAGTVVTYPMSGALPSYPLLEGLWEGEMIVIEQRDAGNPMVPPFEGNRFPFRLDIGSSTLVMYFDRSGAWMPVGQRADLQLNQKGRSAIVIAVMSVGDPTETWVLNVMRSDEERITVHLSQLVSADKAQGLPPSLFSALGQMTRVPPRH